MSESEALIASLEGAVAKSPDDLGLRLHLVELLLQAGRSAAALRHAAEVLERDPDNVRARELAASSTAAVHSGGIDSERVEVFASASSEAEAAPDLERTWDLEPPTVTLADVGGMEDVKRRLNEAFLVPMKNPELRAMYRTSLRGGLLLYGPPGCGKTFMARAAAGELGARFFSIGLADVLDMWMGQSERNLHDIFELARRSAPCVLFLDEVDALGQKRSHLRHHAASRGVVNQLLAEMDGVDRSNEGVFLLAATNHPWDVDTALTRPGRLDRMLLVLPPDLEARRAIITSNLADRPVGSVDVDWIAGKTEGFSGADLVHVVDSAAGLALSDSIRAGTPRSIQTADFKAALRDVRPSTGAWFEVAKNYAMFANEAGHYDDLLAYMRKRRLA
jgi:SpoVK/Ycf46/Vps4 family AAA+-type ATPase